MTDYKFTDDEIIKALEVHSDTENPCMGVCPYSGDRYCGSKMAKEALALINRQKNALEREIYNGLKADEEIEYLKSENARLITSNSQLEARACEDRAEIERLQAVHADMTESLRLAAETNKDMQAEIERLKNPISALYVCELTDELIEVLKQQPFLISPANNEDVVLFDESKIKTEAIKEFAWRLKNILTPYPEAPFCEMVGSLDIDALVEEMTEESK